MVPQKTVWRPAIVNALIETFGFSPAMAVAVVAMLSLLAALAALWVVKSAPPDKIVLIGGPEDSSFHRWAVAYQKELAEKHHVTLEIRASGGSRDNLKALLDPDSGVDIGFVTGGLPEKTNVKELRSLGSVAYQPLLLFYRSPAPITRLSELAGKRIALGSGGGSVRDLALTLLQANGVTAENATFSDLSAAPAATALLEGKLDAIFLMGDSAPIQTLRTLVRTPEVQLFSFRQADVYVRRFDYLNRIVLPEGAIDLGKNLPAQPVTLVGPTVELVARKNFNPALTDLVLEVAREVHGKSSIIQKRGEFPAPLEHEFKLSSDAVRYYKSGQSFMYSLGLPFWIANLGSRILVAAIPLALLVIPIFRFLPVAYRLSIRLRLYKCYRPLLRIERDAVAPLTPERAAELQARLDEVEEAVNKLKVPASFADAFYELRLHVAFVRQRLAVARQN